MISKILYWLKNIGDGVTIIFGALFIFEFISILLSHGYVHVDFSDGSHWQLGKQ
jgi:hypothetical protein